MSTESFGHNDALPPQPPSGSAANAGAPGYPPAGQQERLAAIRAQEAAAQSGNADAQLEGALASLDAAAERPAQRTTRLGQFLEEYFKGEFPPEAKSLAVAECQLFENDCRELFEEPDLKLTEEDASDPGLRERIVNLAAVTTNDEMIAAKTEEQAALEGAIIARDGSIGDNEAAIARLEAEEVSLNAKVTQEAVVGERERTGLAQDEAKNAEVDRDLQTVKELQANFEQLKAERGTITALQTLIGPDGVKSPEMREIVTRVLATAQALQQALPGKPEVVERLLNTANLDLSAGNASQIFAGFLAEADKSEDLTEDEKDTLRAVIGASDRDINTGSDVRAAALATTIDPATGNEVPLHTEDNKAEVVPGVFTYTENGENVILEMNAGSHMRQIDVTGMDGSTIGLLAETMGFFAATEELGATSFVESIYKVDFSMLGESSFDPISLIEMRQKLSYMVGGWEGYDGEIFDPREKAGLIRDQMRVISPTNTALGWENDHEGAQSRVKELGLDNLIVLEEFGCYTQMNYMSGTMTPESLQDHLHRKFPNLVQAPETTAEDAA